MTPFKGIFQATFFVSIGMLLDPAYVLRHPALVAGTALAVVAGKALIAALALRAIGLPARVAAATGVLLAQVGEFSFVLIALGRERGLLPDDHYQLLLAASFISMAVAPPLISNVRAIVDRLARVPGLGRALSGDPADDRLKETSVKLAKHLVVCGFGPIGREVATFARNHALDYVTIELNPKCVEEFGLKGEPIFFGDFANPRVLEHAGIERARALVIAAPDIEATHRAVKIARSMNPGLLIVARTKYHGQAAALVAGGANEVIEEEFETAVELVARLGRAFQLSRSTCVEDMAAQHERAAREGLRALRAESVG